MPPIKTWWFKMKCWISEWISEWWTRILVTGLLLLVIIAVPLTIVWQEKNEEKAEKEERWAQIIEEAKLCEPLFFVEKKLAAHKLWKVTCIDESGKTYVKHVKGDHFIWHWNK